MFSQWLVTVYGLFTLGLADSEGEKFQNLEHVSTEMEILDSNLSFLTLFQACELLCAFALVQHSQIMSMCLLCV